MHFSGAHRRMGGVASLHITSLGIPTVERAWGVPKLHLTLHDDFMSPCQRGVGASLLDPFP